MGRRVALLVATIGLVVLPGTGAGAQVDDGPTTIRTTPGSIGYGYVPPVVVIEVGEELWLQNLDLFPHNVVSVDEGADGEPLFASAEVASMREGPVEGTENLDPGAAYRFICTIHPWMNGALVTRPAG